MANKNSSFYSRPFWAPTGKTYQRQGLAGIVEGMEKAFSEPYKPVRRSAIGEVKDITKEYRGTILGKGKKK